MFVCLSVYENNLNCIFLTIWNFLWESFVISCDYVFSVMSCRSSRSQMFLKIDVLKTLASFARKHLPWSLFLIKLQAKFLRTPSFTEHLQWLLLWFLQQNNLIFSVITITLGYNRILPRKYCNYYHPPCIKISISPTKVCLFTVIVLI